MRVKFKEIANFEAGQSPESKFYSNVPGVPFLQGNRTFGEMFPTIDTYTTKTTKMAKHGDILMSVRAPVGDLNIAPCDLCIGRGLSAISSKSGDNDFLYYALKHNVRNLIRQGNGTTYNSVNKDIVENMEMIIPDSDEECHKIGRLLRAIDDKISNNNAICADLEGMAKLLYDYWFVQFDFPDENGKPYKSSGGKMVWNENLKREIPEGWEEAPLGNIITEAKKSSVQVNASKKRGTYPFFTSGDAVLAYDDFFVDGFHCFLNTGGNPGISAYHGKCAYSTDTWCIDANEYSYLLYYFFLKIMSQFEQLFFAGSGLKHLQKDVLKKQRMVLPPKSIVADFNKTLDRIWIYKSKCSSENQDLTALRDFLLPMLMNGQVKVG